MSTLHHRKVSRVLVMLEYEPGDPDNGEVFDLTALASEMHASHPGALWHRIELTVDAAKTYQRENPVELRAQWQVWCKDMGPNCAHLTDAMNASLPDGDRVRDLRAKANRMRKKAEQLEYEAGVAKLQQVAAVRALHPIARVTASPLPALTP